jgi:hypothetical protein
MLDCLIGYRQATDLACTWANPHGYYHPALPSTGDKSVARVLQPTLHSFSPITASIIALMVLIMLTLVRCASMPLPFEPIAVIVLRIIHIRLPKIFAASAFRTSGGLTRHALPARRALG